MIPQHVLLSPKKVIEMPVNSDDIVSKRSKNETIYYYNLACAYDTESSSFRTADGTPVAITYAHALNIDGYCFLIREWSDFQIVMNTISGMYGTNNNMRLVIYVHNLPYDFQFMKKYFHFTEVFSNGSERKVLKAVTDTGIEFRDSLILAALKLETVAKNLIKYKIKKLVGDLDYNLIRTPKTYLSAKELGYIINDVIIVEYFIREAIEENKNSIAKIPMTNTGYVRRYCRNSTIIGKTKEASRYRKLINQLTLETDEYNALRSCFAGGFTHASIENVGKIFSNVTCRDFTSSYPARMIQYEFPMGKGEEYVCESKADFYDQLKSYCCLFYAKFNHLCRKSNEGYLSKSHCITQKGVTTNNGRIETASEITLWITDIDFKCIQLSYDIDDFRVGRLWRYKRGYLPTSIVKAVLTLYKTKTEYKGIDEKHAEYMRSKGMLNSVFGMSVQDIIQGSFDWNDLLKISEKVDKPLVEQLQKNNESKSRFLYYPWGVWITAYARYDLFSVIVALGSDYIYADTDSIYYIGDHDDLFAQSSLRIRGLMYKACEHHKIDYALLSPVDIKGKSHPLGEWNHDGDYARFKTLGAKRYMVQYPDGHVSITVSGINKKAAVPYLVKTFGDKIFENFSENLIVPEGYCGKSIHTYIDDAREGEVTDYQGNVYQYSQLSAVHLEETSYQLTISDDFKSMIEWIQEIPTKRKRA